MTTFHSGRQGKVLAGAFELPVTRWSGAFRCELVEITNAGGGGFAEFLPGVVSAQVRISLLWDSDELPNQAPGLVEGGSVSCTLQCGSTDKTFTGTMMIESVSYESVVRGPPVRLEVAGRFTGPYTRPSQS